MYVKIPNPCKEKYEGMSSSELGRMCKVCNTELVDFTNWEIKDIVGYIQKSNQKVCGRIKSPTYTELGHLNRMNWLYISASFLLLTSWNNLKAHNITTSPRDKQQITTANLKLSTSEDSVTLKFIDINNKTLPHAVIYEKNTKKYLHADSKGHIKIPIHNNTNMFYEARLIGYVKKDINILPYQKNEVINVILIEEILEVGEVIVEPNSRVKHTFNKVINSIQQIKQQKGSSTPETNSSIKQRLRKLFNIFSVKDEE
jgi:hypothetical protein